MIRRFLVAASAAALTLGLAPGAYAALPTVSPDGGGAARSDALLRLADDGEPALYIVRLDAPAVATYDGGIAGLAPTRVADGEQLDAQSAPVRRYEDYLLAQQAEVVEAAQQEIGRAPRVAYQYTHALNGFATELTVDEAKAVAQLPDVAAVTVDQLRQLQTDVGPEWIGAPALWGQPTDGIPAEIDGSVYVAAERQRVLGGTTGPSGQAIGASQTYRLDLAAAGATVPAGATAVVLNVTAAGATSPTYLSVCPAGTAATECDDQSNLNPYPAQDIAAQVIVELGTGDLANAVDIYNDRGTVGVFADLAGWFVDAGSATDGALLDPIDPTRVVQFEPVGAGELVTVDLDDVTTVPEGARAVAMNLTGAAVQGDTYVSACSGGTSLDECRQTSVLNLYRGTDAANSTILELSADNTVSFYSDRAAIQLVGDAQGWFVDSTLGGSAFHPTAPVRVLDRVVVGRQGVTTLDLDELGEGVVVPEGTTAVALNLTAAGGTQQTFLSACPGGTAVAVCRQSSVVNPRAGEDRANMVIARVNTDENTVDFYNNVGDVLLYADLAGFFTAVPGGEIVTTGTQGEGMIAGIIDSGIVPENPSFADRVTIAEGGDGYDHSNPFGAGNYVGVCDPDSGVYLESFPCNDKLIGAWDFTTDQAQGGDSPRDDNGHGTHTASTTAGNRIRVTTESLEEPAFVATENIKGVAPHANVIAYDVCGIPTPQGFNPGCSTAAIVAAINQAIEDEVHVINYSIGGGSSDPWGDPDALAFLSARTAGIFVATSAGNSGPGASTVGSPGEAPWMTSVGATTHNREWQNTVQDITAADGESLDPIQGKGFSSGTEVLPLVYAGDAPWENPLCIADQFDEGTSFEGQIVVCDRGTTGRVEKGQVVAALDAAGMILANDEASGASVNGDPHALPAVNISYEAGVELKTWMAEVEGETAAISGAVRVVADELGDRQAGFSSRGPNLRSDTLVPSLSAPGVDILAANGSGDDVQWGFISGTSMASPHVAGAGLLMKDLHPGWEPAEIESALMTTADTTVIDIDRTPADWFDMGAGRVDLTRARDAGVVLNENTTDYLAADPLAGGDSSTLNLASMTQGACVVTCTWERILTATETGVGTWTAEGVAVSEGIDITVEPATFTFDRPDRTQVITVTANVADAELGAYAFGAVVLTPPQGSIAPAAHLPVSAFSSNVALSDELVVPDAEESGTAMTDPIRSAFDVTDLQAEVTGLVRGTETELSIEQDPTTDDAFDSDAGTEVTLVDVPEGATRFVASLQDPTAPDFDLYVGTGTEPSEDTTVCVSAAGGSLEECDFVPEEGGQYWVLVQNWEASEAGEDTVTLITATTVEDEGNLTVGDPVPAEPVEAGTEFTVPVTWTGLTEPGQWYATVTLGTNADDPDDIGTFFVTIDRQEDDPAGS
ncbi:S8 family peptidase [uncultured Cellulomonas sp.]|uniref:S8 family peptidase n=1 Tax=uncultured Cellulomonas sp. TaxID=189682 RepID=UPI00262547F3|nr:S8 family peptidase [uncultured Cellulomonas sp.]